MQEQETRTKEREVAMKAMSGPSKSEEKKWQSEEDIRTMERMMEIGRDGPRKRRMKRLAKMKAAEMMKMSKKMGKMMD